MCNIVFIFCICRESEHEASASPRGGGGEGGGRDSNSTTITAQQQARGSRGSTGGYSASNSIANSYSNNGGNGGINGGGVSMEGRKVSGGGSNGGGINNGAANSSNNITSLGGGSEISQQQTRGDNTSSGSIGGGVSSSGGVGTGGSCVGVVGGASRVTTTTTTTTGSSGGGPGRRAQRLPSLRLANGRVAVSTGLLTGSDEEVRSPRSAAAAAAAAALREDIKISLDTTTCTDSLITAVEDETAFVNDFISHEMNYKEPGKVHFGGDEISLYGTPKEEMVPSQVPTAPPTPGVEPKPSFLKNQLQALFQPTDNKLAMKLFGSKKALMKERIRQKAAGHWIIHPCSNFR